MPTPTPRRRTPPRDELRIWREFIETTENVRQRMAARMQHESDLSPSDYQVLLALAEADERRIRSSELADLCGWERSRLSHQLRRMEARGLVRRDAGPEDRRASWIELTGDGADAFRRGSVPHFRAVGEFFIDALTSEQLVMAATLTSALQHHLTALDE